MRKIFLLLYTLLLITGCGNPQVPSDYDQSDRLPDIYPDYAGVTIPINMAPLHFQLTDDWADEDVVTRFSAPGTEEVVCQGHKVRPSLRQWRQLAEAAKGGDITVEVFTRQDGDRWTLHRPFAITVSPDSIDPWLSYRLISPSYVAFEDLTINQRNLESFEERIIYSNMLCSNEDEGQCINCHSYQQGNPDRMQMHARLNHGGTLILMDGKPTKVNLKTDSTISAGVYPSWHPTLSLIAYSTNKTLQMFHTLDVNKVEVLDAESDIILYDITKNKVHIVENRKDEFEVFPSWSPDGRWLYYSSAHFESPDSLVGTENEAISRYKDIKYNIYRKSFDPATMAFGPRELVFDAAALNLSATLPRVSPDGRWLLVTAGEWGCFHIWHRDADLWLVDLTTNEAHPWKEINSDNVESYHTWSRSGRWVVFSSRRYDGNYTRPFFAHVTPDGHASKPFELPCDDPDQHRQQMKSYNIPEFMVAPVTVSPQTLADALKTEAVQATLK